MTDVEDTDEVIEGPPPLGAEEPGYVGASLSNPDTPTLLGSTG